MCDNNEMLSDPSERLLSKFAEDELLLELYNEREANVFQNIVFEGKRRYYVEDLTQKDYNLENTTPYQIKINDTLIEAKSWGLLLVKVTQLLNKINHKSYYDLVKFRSSWSKQLIFSRIERNNFKYIFDDIYLNCNHTALHSCWLLQELLDYYGIDRGSVYFLIHRPCGAEPANVREYIAKKFKYGFIEFLMINKGKSQLYANKVVNNIEKYLNSKLAELSRSYNNFFLFDDNTTMRNYVNRIRDNINNSLQYKDKTKNVINKYLDWIIEYYKE